MTISLPSKPVYVIDVPEVKKLNASFVYNFFVPDESENAIAGIPTRVLNNRSDALGDKFRSFARTRVPRYVELAWVPSQFKNTTYASPEELVKIDSYHNTYVGLIKNNLDKIVSEETFSSNNFTSATFRDGDIESKAFTYVKDAYEEIIFEKRFDRNVSTSRAAYRLKTLLGNSTSNTLVNSALVGASLSRNTRFSEGNEKLTYFDRLRQFFIHAQISSRFIVDIVRRGQKDPTSPYKGDMDDLLKKGLDASASGGPPGAIVDESEYKTIIPHIDAKVQKFVPSDEKSGVKAVGYIIERFEIDNDGNATALEPIVIENPKVIMTSDVRVKYGAKYAYAIRSIALFTLPAIDYDTGEMAVIRFLVSSKPSNVASVEALEFVAPPPPADLNFTWNYEDDKLMIHWAFPPNPQRDIKRFQIFRRLNTDSPFELLKEYDFDDSTVRWPSNETPRPQLVDRIKNPVTFYYDDDFKVPRSTAPGGGYASSRYIYAVCCIDAHGLTSCYSEQFEITFDQFKNQIVKNLISHSGAPKHYPNMFIEQDAFVDTIRVQGQSSKRMKLYFNPEFYEIENNDKSRQKVVLTGQDLASYKLQFINVDSQKNSIITVTINDTRSADGPDVDRPASAYGPAKM